MTNSLKVGLLGGLLLISLIVPIVVRAAEFRTGDSVTFGSGESIVNDLYMAGGTVTSAGTIQGDLTVAGGTLLVNGPVSADLFAGGGTITVLSEVVGDVRVAGGTIVIQGPVQGDVIAAGGQITLAGPKIGGDVAVAGGSVSIDAPITGTLRAAGGEVRVNAPVTGDVFIQAETVVLGPKAALSGKLTYSASKELRKDEGATVVGETKYTPNPDVRGAAKAGMAAFLSLWAVAKFFMILTGALLFGLLFQRYSRELVATAATQPLMEIGRGAIIFIVVPVASFILLMTVIGVPLGIMGLLGYALLLIGVSLLMPIVLGSVVYKWMAKTAGYVVDWKTIFLGVALYFVLSLIPVLGWIVNFGVFLITLGAMMNIKWAIAKEWR